MKVFWSWQSDRPAKVNKNFVKDALDEALQLIGADLDLQEAERPELDHDTKGEAGLVEIVATIFRKIESASAFVADVTPIARTEQGKMVPNPNVMIELGHAMKSLGHESIILVANTAYGGRPEDLPFDLRHRRGAITYHLKPNADEAELVKTKKQLVASLESALAINLGAALAKRDVSATFNLQSCRVGDPSIWLQSGEAIEHGDYFGGAGQHSVTPVDGTRSYMRIVPIGWTRDKPTRLAVQKTQQEVRLWPLGQWTNGDGGANTFGCVSVAVSAGESAKTTTATQWFDKSGEIWGFDSGITDISQGKTLLAHYRIVKDWSTFLRKSLTFLNYHGARMPIRVEAGVAGLEGTYWAAPTSGQTHALEPSIIAEHQSRVWSAEVQLAFVLSTYNILRIAFNQPPASETELARILVSLPE